MDPRFWHDKWSRDEIGFHKDAAHPLLVAHIDALELEAGARVFLPLCGKTLDISWLMARGFHVVGAELSRKAVEQVFVGLAVAPEITEVGTLTRFRGDGIELFAGDIFDLSREAMGNVDAVYDRAALVALPQDMRRRYAKHLVALTASAPQLLITFEYDQSAMNGPPFSVPASEVRGLYEIEYEITPLASVPVEGGLKGHCPAMEEVWKAVALPKSQ